MRKLKYIFLLSVSLAMTKVHAVDDCSSSLSTANYHYEKGEIQSCIDLLTPCLNSFDSKEEKVEAYRLLSMAYQNLNDFDNMQKYAELLLKEDPHYQETSLGRDHKVFTELISSYTVLPKWALGVNLGYVSNQASVIQNHQAFKLAQSVYHSLPSYQFALSAKHSIGEMAYSSMNINFSGAGIDHRIQIEEAQELRYLERFDLMGVSLGFGVNKELNSTMDWQMSLHLSMDYLYNNHVLVEMEEQSQVTSLQTYDKMDLRTRIFPAFVLGTAVQYPTANGDVVFNLAYKGFLKPTMTEDQIYADPDFNISTLYNNDLLRVTQVSVSLTYFYTLNYNILKKGI